MSELLTDEQREEIDRRVHDGALMLDRQGPRSWARQLNDAQDVLDVGSFEECPLGILFGVYETGIGVLGLKSADAALLGFTIVVGDGLDDGSHGTGWDDGLDDGSPGTAWDNAAWDAMSAAWRREAAQRVAAAAT